MDFIKLLIYDLKKQYGEPVDLYVQKLTNTNLETGIKTIQRTKYHLRKVPVVPVKFLQGGFYSSAYLKAAGNFTLGGYQNQEVKDFFIDRSELPKGFLIASEDYIIRRHFRYEIANIMEFEGAYICTGKRLTGQEVNEIHDTASIQTIRFTQNATCVKE